MIKRETGENPVQSRYCNCGAAFIMPLRNLEKARVRGCISQETCHKFSNEILRWTELLQINETCLLFAGMSWSVYVCCHCQRTFFLSKNEKGGNQMKKIAILTCLKSVNCCTGAACLTAFITGQEHFSNT